MATTETISANYAGEFARRYIAAATLSADSLENGAVSVQPNVKYKWNVPKLSLSGIVADATCDFTAAGTVTLADRVLTTESFEVNLKLCKANYRDTWEAIQMGYSAHDQLPPSFADFLIGEVAAAVAANRENTLWQGVNATAGEFDGFETLLASNADQPTGLELAGTTVTSSNVVAQIESVLDAAPAALYSAPGFAIRIPVNIAKHYKAAQAALGAAQMYNEREAEMTFLGVPLIVCPGMSDDVMIAAAEDNLFYGIGLMDDLNQVKVIDQSDIDGSDNVHVVMKFADGIQYGIADQIVTYGITNTAN